MVENASQSRIVPFPRRRKSAEKPRKAGMNHNREGSVRRINGRVYVDFMYLGERVREPSGLDWNEKNAKIVREQLDRISLAIKGGTFRFAEVFPQSNNREYFSEKERKVFDLKPTPDHVIFRDFADQWYGLRRDSGRLAGRTLREYRSYMDNYLIPFFGEMSFSRFNAHLFEEFVSWARKRRLKAESVCNKSINKYFVPLKMICRQAAIAYRWGSGFDPFFGFKRLPEEDRRDDIFPFSLEEQKKLRRELPEHWRPYFDFAIRSGLRPGEQIGLKLEDIDWTRSLLFVDRAITLDENGKRTEGNTKNKYSRRKIKLTPGMIEPLKEQMEIHDPLGCEYFFCTPNGCEIHLSNLRRKVWIPALKRAGVKVREMKQTRHTFATVALSCGENPLWIARVMGHRDAEMVIKVYSRYVEDLRGSEDGSILDAMFRRARGKQG
jgi:integrase